MKRLSITVSDETAEELERLSDERGVSKAKVVEKAIADLAKAPVWPNPGYSPYWHTIPTITGPGFTHTSPYFSSTSGSTGTVTSIIHGEDPPDAVAV